MKKECSYCTKENIRKEKEHMKNKDYCLPMFLPTYDEGDRFVGYTCSLGCLRHISIEEFSE